MNFFTDKIVQELERIYLSDNNLEKPCNLWPEPTRFIYISNGELEQVIFRRILPVLRK